MITPEILQRFIDQVDMSGDCWIWTGTLDAYGYGRFRFSVFGVEIEIKSHRFAWLVSGDCLPDSPLILRHKCNVRNCVRRDHLHSGTHADNSADMVRSGRSARGDMSGRRKHPESYTSDRHWTRLYPELIKRGEESPNSKLKVHQVHQIRSDIASGQSMRSVAKKRSVSFGTVRKIVLGQMWRDA